MSRHYDGAKTWPPKQVHNPMTCTTEYLAEDFGQLLSGKYTAKSLARLTGRGIETAKNWLNRRNCPTLAATIDLARQDDDVWNWLCQAAGRQSVIGNLSDDQRQLLADAIKLMEGRA